MQCALLLEPGTHFWVHYCEILITLLTFNPLSIFVLFFLLYLILEFHIQVGWLCSLGRSTEGKWSRNIKIWFVDISPVLSWVDRIEKKVLLPTTSVYVSFLRQMIIDLDLNKQFWCRIVLYLDVSSSFIFFKWLLGIIDIYIYIYVSTGS